MRLRKGNRRRIRAERHREMRAIIDWIFDLRRPAVSLYPSFTPLWAEPPRVMIARKRCNKRMTKISAELSRRAGANNHPDLFSLAALLSKPSAIKGVRLMRIPRREP